MTLPELSKPATRLNFGTKFAKLHQSGLARHLLPKTEPPIWAAYAKMKPSSANAVLWMRASCRKWRKKPKKGIKRAEIKREGQKRAKVAAAVCFFSLATVHNERVPDATSRFLTHSLCKFNQSVIKFNFKSRPLLSQANKKDTTSGARQQKDHRQVERGNNCLFIRDYSWARPRFD